jgi:hypothetical protein
MSTQDQPTGKSSIQPIPVKDRIPKKWVEAKRKYSHTQQHRDNILAEHHFMQLLNRAKQLLKNDNTKAFDRDYRGCNATDAFAMQVFICPSVYLYLECSYDFVYRVQYAFNSCRHEDEIRKLLNGYLLKGRAKEVQLKPDFNTFYNNVLAVQDAKHIISL